MTSEDYPDIYTRFNVDKCVPLFIDEYVKAVAEHLEKTMKKKGKVFERGLGSMEPDAEGWFRTHNKSQTSKIIEAYRYADKWRSRHVLRLTNRRVSKHRRPSKETFCRGYMTSN